MLLFFLFWQSGQLFSLPFFPSPLSRNQTRQQQVRIGRKKEKENIGKGSSSLSFSFALSSPSFKFLANQDEILLWERRRRKKETKKTKRKGHVRAKSLHTRHDAVISKEAFANRPCLSFSSTPRSSFCSLSLMLIRKEGNSEWFFSLSLLCLMLWSRRRRKTDEKKNGRASS